MGKSCVTRRGLLGLLSAAGAGVFVGACGDRGSSIRYKMTVEVNTPQGVRSGYAVREVTTQLQHSAESVFETVKVRGEAVAVDLPNGHTLFALLTGGRAGENRDYAGWIVHKAGLTRERGMLEDLIHTPVVLFPSNMPESRFNKQEDLLPLFVFFYDNRQAESVRSIPANGFEPLFGANYNLKRVDICETSEIPAFSIRQKLIDLGIEPGHNLDKDYLMSTHPNLAQRLGYKDFIKDER